MAFHQQALEMRLLWRKGVPMRLQALRIKRMRVFQPSQIDGLVTYYLGYLRVTFAAFFARGFTTASDALIFLL